MISGFSIIRHKKRLCRKWLCFYSAFETNLRGYVGGLGINQRKGPSYRKSGVGSKVGVKLLQEVLLNKTLYSLGIQRERVAFKGCNQAFRRINPVFYVEF